MLDTSQESLKRPAPVGSVARELGLGPKWLSLADAIPIEALHLPLKALKWAATMNLDSVGDVARSSEEELLPLCYWAGKSLVGLRQLLREFDPAHAREDHSTAPDNGEHKPPGEVAGAGNTPPEAAVDSTRPTPQVESAGGYKYDWRVLALDERPLGEILRLVNEADEGLQRVGFDRLDLSIRAFNCLKKSAVLNVGELLNMSPAQLMRIRGFGIGCLADVTDCLRKLFAAKALGVEEGSDSEGESQAIPEQAGTLPVTSLAYELGYGEEWLSRADAIPVEELGLSLRAYNCVRKVGLQTVGELGRLSSEELIAIRNMGRKSLADIKQNLAMLHPGVEATPHRPPPQEYRADGTTGAEKTSTRTPFKIDPDQPYPSLTEWVSAVCKKSDRQQQAFLLRHGMHGRPPATLQQIGDSLGVGRARAQQLVSKAETGARKPHFARQLRPLIDRAAEIIHLFGGMLSKEELVRRLLVVGPGGEMLAHATSFVEFLASLPEWCDAGLRLGSICTCEASTFAKRLSSVLVQIAEDTADERLGPGLWSVSIDVLRRATLRWARADQTIDPIESISEAIIDYALQHVSGLAKRKGDRIFSADLWELRFGKRVALVEMIVKNFGRAMHYSEVYQQAKRLRPQDARITERGILASLSNSRALLLWDRGSFIHRSAVAVPLDLLETIESWIEQQLARGIAFYSISGAFREYEIRCRESGLVTETSLYTCLKELSRPRLVYPRYPYVLPPGVERIPVVAVIEQYIDEANGTATYDEVKHFALGELGVKEFQLQQALSKLGNVITTESGRFVHVEDFQLDKGAFGELLAYLRGSLATMGHVSAQKIYKDRIVTCRCLGVDGPRMLYSLLRAVADSKFELSRYPQIRQRTGSGVAARRGVIRDVIGHLQDTPRPWSLQELEDHFVEALGYDARTVYAVVDRDGVLRYGPGCIVHKSAIGWDAQKQEQLELAAWNAYERARRTGRCYVLVSDFVESHWCDLPTLDHDIPWTETLVACLLARGGRFRILGNARNAFVPVPNNDGIETFEALLRSILANDYAGAATKEALEEDLQRRGIIRRALSPTMLDNGKLVSFAGNAVMLSELHRDA